MNLTDYPFLAYTGLILENRRFVPKCTTDANGREFYLGMKADTSTKGFQRWKRNKAWR